jgi:hypothetical protein
VTLADPTSRRLRGSIGVAVREGRIEDEAALRRELALCNLERAYAREIGDQPLTAAELRRLRLALESYGPQRTQTAHATTNGTSTARA